MYYKEANIDFKGRIHALRQAALLARAISYDCARSVCFEDGHLDFCRYRIGEMAKWIDDVEKHATASELVALIFRRSLWRLPATYKRSDFVERIAFLRGFCIARWGNDCGIIFNI